MAVKGPRRRLVLIPLLLVARPAAADAEETLVPLPAAYARLESGDVAAAAATIQEALEQAVSRDSRRWRNRASGASGVITPLRTFRVADGRYCRDYLEVVMPPGTAPAYRKSTACRSPDGLWEQMTP